MTEHATVQRDGFTVPLLGLPVSSVLGNCECCGAEAHLSDLKFSDSNQLLCPKCLIGETAQN